MTVLWQIEGVTHWDQYINTVIRTNWELYTDAKKILLGVYVPQNRQIFKG